MKKVLCSRCNERPAVVFISKIENGKTVPEGLCLQCAMEMNIGPIKQMMDSMGITEDDVNALSEQMEGMFDAMPDDDEEDEGFEAGGSPTLPFNSMLENLSKSLGMNLNLPIKPTEQPKASEGNVPPQQKKSYKDKKNKEKKRKFLKKKVVSILNLWLLSAHPRAFQRLQRLILM